MKLVDKLKEFDGKIVLAVHEKPDPDCIGSGLALYNFLKKKGKDVVLISKDEPPESLEFLKGFDEIKRDMEEGDLYILVDASEWERTGLEEPSGEIVKIDHHISDKRYSPMDVVDEEAPATADLVLKILREWDEEGIDVEVGECIYAGLLTDTGSFTYSSIDRAMQDALYLLGRGVDGRKVAEKIFRESPFERFKLIGLALQTLTFQDSIAWIIVRNEFYRITGAKRNYNYGIVDYALSVKGALIGVKFEEYEDVWRVSLRSKGNIDVSRIAAEFGGGGHRNAAAFRISGREEEIVDRVIKRLKEYLKNDIGKITN